jgi:DNA-binding MarR family transcriptional regulator
MHPYFAQFGISGAQWGVLRNLHRASQEGRAGLRLTELGERLLIRPPSVTTLVDRLEKAGLVRRDAVPEDQRAKQVVLTDRGRQLLDRILSVHDEQIGRLMACLNPDEEQQLYHLLRRLGLHLQDVLAGGGPPIATEHLDGAAGAREPFPSGA